MWPQLCTFIVLCNREKAWRANRKGSLKSSCSQAGALRLSELCSFISHLQPHPLSSKPSTCPGDPQVRCDCVTHECQDSLGLLRATHS